MRALGGGLTPRPTNAAGPEVFATHSPLGITRLRPALDQKSHPHLHGAARVGIGRHVAPVRNRDDACCGCNRTPYGLDAGRSVFVAGCDE
jgi:hypothetical protein